MAWSQEKINETFEKLQQLVTADEKFRAELLENPNAAIEKLAGEALPEDFNIRVIENDPAYAATFMLPPLRSSELSDDEMESVAGGAGVEGGEMEEQCTKCTVNISF